MSLKICILSSGSSGNSIYIASDKTKLLIDAGLNAKQITLRLEKIGVNLKDINAICISHEHGDHTKAINLIHNKYQIPIYTNFLTKNALVKNEKFEKINFKIFETGSIF